MGNSTARAVRQHELLLRQIHRDGHCRILRDGFEQLLLRITRDDDRQQRVLTASSAEDVGERGADHGAEAILRQRPRRVLARAAAAEVVAGQQHLRALRFAADSG